MLTQFSVGQVWTYATRDCEPDSRITIVRLDEAITLSGIEPFNGAFSHIRILNHDVTGLPTRVVTGPVNVHTVRDN